MNKKEIIKIFLGIVIGAAIFSVSTGILWFLLNYFLAKSTSLCGGMMGCINSGGNSGKSFVSVLFGVAGVMEGIISGSLIGLIIMCSRANKIFYFILGLILNGLIPFIIIALFLGGTVGTSFPSKEALLALSAHCALGGVLGMLINSIFQFRMFNKSELQ